MFEVSIIVGHPTVTGGSQWILGEIDVQHEPLEDGTQPPAPMMPTHLKPIRKKPEIVHQHVSRILQVATLMFLKLLIDLLIMLFVHVTSLI